MKLSEKLALLSFGLKKWENSFQSRKYISVNGSRYRTMNRFLVHAMAILFALLMLSAWKWPWPGEKVTWSDVSKKFAELEAKKRKTFDLLKNLTPKK
jgi:hypothetical protein